jgi:rhodanese-related sulfurtransferase
VLEPIGLDALRKRADQDDVIVLDVRPAEEYHHGHIAGARSIPVGELEARLDELPDDAEVVAYCRGPYCVFADEAVATLRNHGIRARRLDVGFPDWKTAGLPVETTG